MTCEHCVRTIQRALSALEGVSRVEVSLSMDVVELIESDFCPKCAVVRERVERVARLMGVEVKLLNPIDHADRIVELGILTTPAVVVNGKVKFAGVVPTEEKIREAIEEELS